MGGGGGGLQVATTMNAVSGKGFALLTSFELSQAARVNYLATLLKASSDVICDRWRARPSTRGPHDALSYTAKRLSITQAKISLVMARETKGTEREV